MIAISVKEPTGKELGTLQIPERVEEIKLSQAVDMEVYTMKNAADNLTLAGNIQYMFGLLKPFDQDGKLLENLDLGALKTKEALEETEASLMWVYAKVVNTLNSFKPELKEVEYKGYRWNSHVRDGIVNRIVIPNLKVWQAVEVLEANRLYMVNKDHDNSENFRYTYLLKMAAVLAVNGDKLPESEAECMQIMTSRMIELQEMSMDVAYNIENFFLSIGQN